MGSRRDFLGTSSLLPGIVPRGQDQGLLSLGQHLISLKEPTCRRIWTDDIPLNPGRSGRPPCAPRVAQTSLLEVGYSPGSPCPALDPAAPRAHLFSGGSVLGLVSAQLY